MQRCNELDGDCFAKFMVAHICSACLETCLRGCHDACGSVQCDTTVHIRPAVSTAVSLCIVGPLPAQNTQTDIRTHASTLRTVKGISWNEVVLEKLVVAQLVHKAPAFCGT